VLRQIVVEALEARTLLDATLPSPTVLPNSQVDISSQTGNESSPTIVIDQHDPNKLASVWVRNDPTLAPAPTVFVQMSVSNDGGATWSAPTSFTGGSLLNNPTTSNPIVRFPMGTDPSVAFDRNDHIYVLQSQHTGDNSVGALVLNTFDFSGSIPTTLVSNKAVYEWVNVDAATSPTLAVDDIGGWREQLQRGHAGQQQRQQRAGQANQSDADDQPGAPCPGSWNPRAERPGRYGDPRWSSDGWLRRFRLGRDGQSTVRCPPCEPGLG
jgi:hypothetical protein